MDNQNPQDPRPADVPPRDASPEATPAFERFANANEELHRELDGTEPAAAPLEQRPSRKAAWLAMGAVALALGLLWLAPGVDEPHDDAASFAAGDSSADPDAATDAAAVGKAAPLHFTMKDMNGVDVKLASFKGKVILVNFWATWCGPCRVEIPDLVEVQKQYADDLVILGVSIDDPLEKLKPYATEMHINYPVLMGKDREDVQEAFGPFWGIPVSVFIDRNGKIHKRHSGIASRAQLEQEIKALL